MNEGLPLTNMKQFKKVRNTSNYFSLNTLSTPDGIAIDLDAGSNLDFTFGAYKDLKFKAYTKPFHFEFYPLETYTIKNLPFTPGELVSIMAEFKN